MGFGKKKNEKLANQALPNAPLGEFENPAPAPAAPVEKTSKKKAVDKKQGGRPNIFKRIGRSFKEMFSELKKVSWPAFPRVLKQTAIVLVIVFIFLLILLAFDSGLSALFKLLVGIE